MLQRALEKAAVPLHVIDGRLRVIARFTCRAKGKRRKTRTIRLTPRFQNIPPKDKVWSGKSHLRNTCKIGQTLKHYGESLCAPVFTHTPHIPKHTRNETEIIVPPPHREKAPGSVLSSPSTEKTAQTKLVSFTCFVLQRWFSVPSCFSYNWASAKSTRETPDRSRTVFGPGHSP